MSLLRMNLKFTMNTHNNLNWIFLGSFVVFCVFHNQKQDWVLFQICFHSALKQNKFLSNKQVPILQSKHLFIPIWQSYTVMNVSFSVAVCFFTTDYSLHYYSELRRCVQWQFSLIISKSKHITTKNPFQLC